MSYKVRISQPTFDVKTCTDEQLVFSSDWDSMKVYQSGETNVTLLSGSTTATLDIPHTLGYAPLYFIVANGNQSVWTPLPYGAGNRIAFYLRITSMIPYSTTTNVHVDITGTAAGADVPINIKYYIFYNQLD